MNTSSIYLPYTIVIEVMFTKLANELGHHIVRILGKYILSGKFTCWPWKSSFLSGFTNLPTPKTAKVYVNLLEVNGQIVYGCMRNLRVTLSNSGKSTLDVRRLSKKYGKLSSVFGRNWSFQWVSAPPLFLHLIGDTVFTGPGFITDLSIQRNLMG